MDEDRWREIERVYQAALTLGAAKREAFLDRTCQNNSDLRRRVESLLAAKPLTLLDHPAWDALEVPSATLVREGEMLGVYRIEALLGRGGMGEVFRAVDTRLNRKVAIKVSAARFSKRFEREVLALSALNHPHICTLFDVGPDFLVMEYVEGGPVEPTKDMRRLLDVALQIADALVAAHAAGIVHRDLKPANILVTSAGKVKILDFGVAMREGDGSPEPTGITQTGTAVGTAAYMSPEQARAELVDARTDLWSFGVTLYELATGVRPFEGPSAASVFAAILEKAPFPVCERNPEIPAELERIISRLLEKDREVRYQTAADVCADLKRVARDSAAAAAASVSSGQERSAANTVSRAGRRRTLHVPVWIVLLILAGVAFGSMLYLRKSAPPHSLLTSPAEWVQLTDFPDSATAPAFSPGGNMLTFMRGGNGLSFMRNAQIYVKGFPKGEAVQLTDKPGIRYGPAFSPDSSRVAYTEFNLKGGALPFDTWTAPVHAGSPSLFLPNAAGLSWIDERHVLYSEIKGSGVHMGIVTATEGRADEREIYFPDHERAMAHYSYPSPDHKWILIVAMDGTGSFLSCRVAPFDGSSSGREVGPSGSCRSAAWSPDGAWMYFSAYIQGSSHLWRQRFAGGDPEQITFGPATEEVGVAVAPDGSVVSPVGQRQSSVWIHEASGQERPLSSEGFAFSPRLSSDGKRVYYLLRQSPATNFVELGVIDLDTGRSYRPLPDVSVRDFDISSDEREVAYTTVASNGKPEIWLMPVDHHEPPHAVTRNGDDVSFGAGDELLFRGIEEKQNFLMRVRKDGTGRARVSNAPILNKDAVSTDGTWVLAGISNAAGSGLPGSVAIPLDGGEARLICRAYCTDAWSPDGRFLYVDTAPGEDPGRTLVLSVAKGASMPELPPGISADQEEAAAIPGVLVIPRTGIAPSLSPSTFAFVKSAFLGNLFQIPFR